MSAEDEGDVARPTRLGVWRQAKDSRHMEPGLAPGIELHPPAVLGLLPVCPPDQSEVTAYCVEIARVQPGGQDPPDRGHGQDEPQRRRDERDPKATTP